MAAQKAIFLDRLNNSIPTLYQVKLFTKSMYEFEEFKFVLKDKENIFERRWGILKDHYGNKAVEIFLSKNIT